MKKLILFVIAVCVCITVSTVGGNAFAESVNDMLICEKFESVSGSYYLRSASIVGDVAIGDDASLLCKSTSEWNDFVTFKAKIAANKTYTVAFRYNFINVTSGAFAYVNIKSASNVDDAAYLGFNENGVVTSYGANYVGAGFDIGFYRTTAFVTFTVGEASDYALVFGAKGTVSYVLDDITLTEGTEPTFINSEFVPRDELMFEENFEDGYGVLDGINGNFVPQGKLAYDGADVIDGKYSVCASSADSAVAWLCGSGSKVKLAANAVYTLLLRVRTDGAAKLCVAVSSDSHGQKSTLANFDEQGRLYSDMSYNVASYVTKPTDGYREIRIIFTTPSEGNSQLRFGVRGGKISLDNVRLYKNAADVSFDGDAVFVGGGVEQPTLSLPQAIKPKAKIKYESGKVIGELNVVFEEFVLPLAETSETVTLTVDGEKIDCRATFDISSRTLNVCWDDDESKYKYVTLTVEDGAFVNADELGNEKIITTFFNGANDIKAFADAWEQVKYGDEQTRKAATKTALEAYADLSDKEYFAEAYEQVKKLADWYAQQDKTDEPLKPSVDDPKKDGNGIVLGAVAGGAAALLLAVAAVVIFVKKKKK